MGNKGQTTPRLTGSAVLVLFLLGGLFLGHDGQKGIGNTTYGYSGNHLKPSTAVSLTMQNLAAALTSLTVAPETTSVPIGLTQQYTAAGAFDDDTFQAMTSLVTWNSSNPTAAAIDDSGLATALALGGISDGSNHAELLKGLFQRIRSLSAMY